MSDIKQFTLYSAKGPPNGWKVAFVLEELGLTYKTIFLDLTKGAQREPEFIKYNPNGRIPVIIDHGNNDFVLWESNAIIEYLVERYDKENKISIPATDNQKYVQTQWLWYQGTGQGPYFGQAGWFLFLHPEKVPSAVERYRKEILRVYGVLESVLSKQEWLAGGKPTVADISFIPYTDISSQRLLEDFQLDKEFPAVAAWHKKLLERPAIKKVWDEWRRKIAEIESQK